jgi:DinB superfamily
MSTSLPEAWLRGPVPGMPALLNPAAHALQHAAEDAARALDGLSPELIWCRAGDAATVGYHVRHLIGALDRLLTYARGESLTHAQLQARARESEAGDPPADSAGLLAELTAAIDRALEQLRRTPEASLLDARAVGRQHLPSTVIGLIFHAAEHSARHGGQALTTAKILRIADCGLRIEGRIEDLLSGGSSPDGKCG